jgi:predicted secreted protein
MALFAHGTTFEIENVPVGGLTGISLPAESRDSLDSTDHDANGIRTFLPGLVDGGTVELEGHLIPGDAGQGDLRDNKNSGAPVECIITVPSTPSSIFTFDAFVTAVGGDAPFDGLGTFSASLKVTGPVVVTAGS